MEDILKVIDIEKKLIILIDSLNNSDSHVYIVDYLYINCYEHHQFKNLNEAFLFIEKNHSISRLKFYQGKVPLEAIDNIHNKRLLIDYDIFVPEYCLWVSDLSYMKCADHYYQDDIKYIYEDAYEFFGVTKDKFHKIDFNKLPIKE